jgi:hypothetical protein
MSVTLVWPLDGVSYPGVVEDVGLNGDVVILHPGGAESKVAHSLVQQVVTRRYASRDTCSFHTTGVRACGAFWRSSGSLASAPTADAALLAAERVLTVGADVDSLWFGTGERACHVSNESGALAAQMTALAKFYIANMRALDNPATYGYNGETKGLGASRVAKLVATDPYAQDQSGFSLGEWHLVLCVTLFDFYAPPCSLTRFFC